MFGRYIVGGRLDPPYYPTKPYPHFVGRQIDIPFKAQGDRVIKDTFTMSHDLEFYAISFLSSMISVEDYWNLTVDGKMVAKNIFQVAHPVKAGTEFRLEYFTPHGDSKQVSVTFHFLTEPDLDLVLTGTTDLGNYPDSPPEPPENAEPPTPPAGGGIQLPVAWQPFASVTEAQKWASDLGVDATFAGKLNAANYVTEALALLLNTCGGFADMIQQHKLKIRLQSMSGANGAFNPAADEVQMNKAYQFDSAAEIAQADYDAGMKSSPHRLRTIIHEIGHWLHFHGIGEQQFYQFANLDPDNYGSQTILSNTDATAIANDVGSYATKWFPIELVAEVFTAKMTGEQIEPKTWEYYQQYGGYKCSEW
jgi:hypothetical protein